MAEGMFGLDPAMVQELINKERGQQANQFVEGLGQTGLGASLFNPIARGAYGLLQQTKDTLNPDPRIQKAQAMEQIKTIASQKAQAGSPEFYQVIIEEAQRLNVPEVAEKAQAKLMEIEKSRQESFSKNLTNQKTAIDIQKTATELSEGRKNEDLDPFSRTRFKKNFYQLDQEQQKLVLKDKEEYSLKIAEAKAFTIVNEAQKKGMGEFGLQAGKQVFESYQKMNQIDESIIQLEKIREDFKKTPMITGGGKNIQSAKEIGYKILNEFNLLSPNEISKLDDTQAMKAALNKVTLEALGGSLGAQISNSDRDFIAEAFGQLGQNPNAVVKIYDKIIDIKRRERNRIAKTGEFAIKAIKEGDPSVFSEEFKPKQSQKWEDLK